MLFGSALDGPAAGSSNQHSEHRGELGLYDTTTDH